MKQINVTFGVFIIITLILVCSSIEEFNIGGIIIVISILMAVLNIMECLKLYKTVSKKGAIISRYMLLVSVMLAILVLISHYKVFT